MIGCNWRCIVAMSDAQVGIEEYLNADNAGFDALYKYRVSDFVVNEIDESGQVVHLEECALPETKPNTGVETMEDKVAHHRADLLTLFGHEHIDRLLLVARTRSGTLVVPAPAAKEHRKQLHDVVRLAFDGQLISAFRKAKPDQPAAVDEIVIAHQQQRDFVDKRSAQPGWPREFGGDYCQFVLYKENCGTMEALSEMARWLRAKPNLFSYAGTKDKRARTCQLVTAFRVRAEKVREVNARWSSRAVLRVGGAKYVQRRLELGDLAGNRFELALRDVRPSPGCCIDAACRRLAATGFINYFGLQRFGLHATTYQVGRLLLKSDWPGAVDLILAPKHLDGVVGNKQAMAAVERARCVWAERKDAADALRQLEHFNCAERSLLMGLKVHASGAKRNYVNALAAMPRNQRLLYVHAYQSYLWNRLVSRRIREYGTQVLVGDLFFADDNARSVAVVRDDQHRAAVRIDQVAMPLPGYDVLLPDNAVGAWYAQMLRDDAALSLTDLRHSVKDYALPGAYRRVIVRPTHLRWRIVNARMNEDLIESDFEKIKVDDALPVKRARADERPPSADNADKPDNADNADNPANGDGELVDEADMEGFADCGQTAEAEAGWTEAVRSCLVMSFHLPSSCYATMALRELMHRSTDYDRQIELTKAATSR